ncbi:hypothetical protein [Sulfitobacter alexandrii]|uniref:hypothetical protein n=1 Tax=Sulfitobacter alexandrii TaxID=1917485 RepID=UPI0012EB20C9|nr:hypothetical protein [Sulfitobacter alexandrii]
MVYLIYEQDPFVRADICEALSAEFPDKTIVETESLESLEKGLSDFSHRLADVNVVFVTSTDNAVEDSRFIAEMPPIGRLVLVADERIVDTQANPNPVYISKPFSTHGLMAAIRDGRSDRPASPSQTPR